MFRLDILHTKTSCQDRLNRKESYWLAQNLLFHCSVNWTLLMDMLVFKKGHQSCKNWNIFVTWLLCKKDWSWMIDSEGIAGSGETSIRQPDRMTDGKPLILGQSSEKCFSGFIFYKTLFSNNCTSWCFSFVSNSISQQDIPGFHGWMEISILSAWAEWSRTEIGKNKVIIFVI